VALVELFALTVPFSVAVVEAMLVAAVLVRIAPDAVVVKESEEL
jgi:hypothetical protein